MRRIQFTFLFVTGLIAIATSPGCKKDAGRLSVAFNTWVGYGPFFVAREKGFYDKRGLKVDLSIIEGIGERNSAIASGKLDAIGTTADASVLAAQGGPVKIVAGIDKSVGADGIVATTGVANVRDLAGKTVGVEFGYVGHFFLLYLLDEAGVSPSDLTLSNMGTGDAGAAFVAGKVDAAVTFEPWLSKAKTRADGHVLITSRERPGVIVDTLLVSGEAFSGKRQAVQALVDAWHEAIDFIRTNPDEAAAIMARSFKLSVEETKEMLSGVEFFTKAENQEYFGRDGRGMLHGVVTKAADIWTRTGGATKRVSPDDLIATDLLF